MQRRAGKMDHQHQEQRKDMKLEPIKVLLGANKGRVVVNEILGGMSSDDWIACRQDTRAGPSSVRTAT